MKIMTIVGTRPEIIKLSRVINELDKHLEHILVHTGQNYDYELNQIFFDQLGIRRPNYFLEAIGSSLANTIGNIISKADQVMERERPDAILLLGDTNSCLSAISAKRRKIPIFHMEAGNRCFDLRVPEEINRKIVDHLSDINLPYTEHARRYLLDEGIKPETIIKTGSPMKEVLNFYSDLIDNSNILDILSLRTNGYFVVSFHREENVDDINNFSKIVESLEVIAKNYDKPIIVSTHPRTKKQLEKINIPCLDGRIQFINPLGFPDYIKLQKNALCVISDSGTITEESSILGFPAITIRQAHERPEGMDEGVLIMSGFQADSIIDSIDVVRSQHLERTSIIQMVADYNVDNVSSKVLRIILSYTEYINRIVWRK